MITSLSINELATYTSRQLNFFFPDKNEVNLTSHINLVKLALDKIENCYKKVTLKHYNNDNNVYFNHLYSDHYVMYIWYLANTFWKETGDKNICNKLYYLNKTLHAFDCMFDTQLPDIFLIFHGAGTMLGKATYGNFFVVLQGCTVGMNKGKYPNLANGVALTAHASLIGDCNVGNLVTISSYTNIIDEHIDANTVVFKTKEGKIQSKISINAYAQTFFNCPIL